MLLFTVCCAETISVNSVSRLPRIGSDSSFVYFMELSLYTSKALNHPLVLAGIITDRLFI